MCEKLEAGGVKLFRLAVRFKTLFLPHIALPLFPLSVLACIHTWESLKLLTGSQPAKSFSSASMDLDKMVLVVERENRSQITVISTREKAQERWKEKLNYNSDWRNMLLCQDQMYSGSSRTAGAFRIFHSISQKCLITMQWWASQHNLQVQSPIRL